MKVVWTLLKLFVFDLHAVSGQILFYPRQTSVNAFWTSYFKALKIQFQAFHDHGSLDLRFLIIYSFCLYFCGGAAKIVPEEITPLVPAVPGEKAVDDQTCYILQTVLKFMVVQVRRQAYHKALCKHFPKSWRYWILGVLRPASLLNCLILELFWEIPLVSTGCQWIH